MNAKLIDYCFRALIASAVRDVLRDIGEVNERLPFQDSRKREGPLRCTRTTVLYPVDVARIAMCGDKMEQLAIIGIDMSVVGLTQAHGAFDHRVKDRRKVTRGFVDSPLYFSRCRLLIECFVALTQSAVELFLHVG